MEDERIRVNVKVGAIHKSDIADLIVIDSQSYYESSSMKWFRLNYSRRSIIRFVVAKENGIVIGYTGIVIVKSDIVIVRFGVREDKRREGAGTAMIDYLKARLGRRLRRIFVVVGERNGTAQLFLRSCGFRVYQTGRVELEMGGELGVYLFEYFYCE